MLSIASFNPLTSYVHPSDERRAGEKCGVTDQDDEAVTVELCRSVALVRFQPRADGTISNKGAALLLDSLNRSLAEPDVKAIVLTGARPGIFIRHANLGQIARAAQAMLAGQISEADFLDTPFQQLCRALDRAEKPVIAAINGDCMGGGLEIALACTLRIAAPAVAAIGLPEIRLAIAPGSGGLQRLANVIGPHRARIFILDGTVVGSETALTLGIVDEVSPDPVERALERGEHFARRSPHAVATILRQLAPDNDAAIEENARAFARLLQTTEANRMLDEQRRTPRPIEMLE